METKNLSTYTDPWSVVELHAEAWAAQAHRNGASALKLWADGNLAGYWTHSPGTATAQVRASRARRPKATTVVIEGLGLSDEAGATWLEGTALNVCWRAEVTALSQLVHLGLEHDPALNLC